MWEVIDLATTTLRNRGMDKKKEEGCPSSQESAGSVQLSLSKVKMAHLNQNLGDRSQSRSSSTRTTNSRIRHINTDNFPQSSILGETQEVSGSSEDSVECKKLE